ncbi:MAG TPA: adenylate/guanylate cyclase domain-containing protein [Actinomycetota bacterium]|nr:adenylate/guanylate cyclase domain-containing protein [Actinomycetota bacterium]
MDEGGAKVRPAEDLLPEDFEREVRRLRFEDPVVERAFQDDYSRRRIPQFRVIFWVGLGIQIPLSFRFAFIEEIGPDDPRFWLRLAVGVIPAVAGLLLARSTRAVRWLPVYIVFYVLLIGFVLVSIFATSPIGWTSLTTYLIAACVMSRLRAREVALVEIVLIGWFAFLSLVVLDKPLASLDAGLFSLGTLALFILVAGYLIEHSARRDFLLLRLLGRERERSERLLLNVLPAPIAQRLKESSGTIADSFSEATILFADITDSTPNIARMSAEVAVQLLNDIFSAFDRLADRHGLEKIKTIGDGYMVAGGLPEPRPDHAEAMVAMALDMQTEIARFRWPTGKPMSLRVGINTGPVVAGVIGTRRFIYDLYGDTANVAKRMESHGISGAIQMTQATYDRVRDRYSFTERTIDVRGKGVTATYLLVPDLSRIPDEAPLPTEI